MLFEDGDGVLYGTTYFGGTYGYGTVYRLNKDGSGFAVLKSFDLATDGGLVVANLCEGSDGALYGTARDGGGYGGGTVFRLNKDGSGFEVLLELGALAENPRIPSPVAVGSDGRLYGISYQGGLFGAGTVFQMNQDGSGLVVLKHFDAGNNLGRNDGAIPYSALTEGSDGALYGTASSGGAANSGTVHRMNKDGSGIAVLRSLDPTADGAAPHAAVIEDGDGVLYGTTSFGGLFGGGTVFPHAEERQRIHRAPTLRFRRRSHPVRRTDRRK